MRKSYLVNHKLGLKKYIFHSLREIILNISNFKVSPIKSDIRFCFVVGCGHTGTTLLTSVIAKSDMCMTIGRETSRFSPSLSLATSKAVAEEWIYFSKFLQKKMVVEKTPKHVHCLHRIKKILPDSKVIVITRNPLDTCASLFERFGDLEYCISRWLLDSKASYDALSKFDNTVHVRYEDLVGSPIVTMKKIFSFLEIDWSEEFLKEGSSVYNSVDQTGNMAIRAEQVQKGIYLKENRWKKVFSRAQAERVAKETSVISGLLGYGGDLDA